MLRVFILVLILSYGCNSVNNSDTITKKWYYPDGTLMKYQEFTSDSIETGVYKFYYPNGVLEDSAYITNGKFHGNRYLFYQTGILHQITTYFNDKFRYGITYRKNGILEYYRAYNHIAQLMFIMHYDSIGNPDWYKGEPIYSFILEEDYPINEEFQVEVLVANPPKFTTNVSIIESESGIQFKIPDNFNRVMWRRKQNPIKDIQVLTVAEMKSDDFYEVVKDTLSIEVSKDGKTQYQRY